MNETQIHELPSIRGCTYFVPARDFGLALRLGRGNGDPTEVAVAKKWLGVTEDELEKLQHAVLEALKAGPMDPKQIRDAVGDAVRGLGDEGKKRGQTTTLPLALGLLQGEGHIRRMPVDGRLDQQRYKYIRWDPSPMEGFYLSLEESCVELARHYFRWIGPATRASFQAISGLGVRATEATLSNLELVPIEEGNPFMILSQEKADFEAFQVPTEPQYAVVSCLDNLSHLHWGIESLVAEEDHGRQALGPKGMMNFGGMKELENHAIYDRGRIVGLWEYDSEAAAIVYQSFIPMNDDLKSALRRTEEFGRSLGDVRSFSLDSPESRKPRIEALRDAE